MEATAVVAEQQRPNILRDLKHYYLRNHLVVGFCIAWVAALAWPLPGQVLYAPAVHGVHVLPFVGVALVFFLSGLTLRTDELKAAFTKDAAGGTVFGVLSILIFVPLLGFAFRPIPLQPVEYIVGTIVLCVVPTAVGVGIALATLAKANVGLAIFLTVVTNVIGIAAVPLWLKAMLSTPGSPLLRDTDSSGSSSLTASININVADMFVKLVLSNLAPIIIGKLLRESINPVRTWVLDHSTHLAIAASSSLSIVTWSTLSSARDAIVDTTFGTMLLVILLIGVQHVASLAFNAVCMKLLRVRLPEAVATVLLGSQKAPPVAYTVITYMTPDPVTQGMLAVPAIVNGLLTILIDQPLVNYYRQRIEAWEAEQETEQQALPDVDLTAVVPSGSSNSSYTLKQNQSDATLGVCGRCGADSAVEVTCRRGVHQHLP